MHDRGPDPDYPTDWKDEMTDEFRFDLGRHDEAIDNLKAEVSAMRKDVSDIKAIVSEAKGSVRILLLIGSIGGAVGAAITKGIAMLKGGV
jgi:hypothetical protein